MKNSDENSNLIKTALDKDYPLHSMEEGSRRRYYFDAYSRSNMRIAAVYNSKKEAEDDLSNFAYYIVRSYYVSMCTIVRIRLRIYNKFKFE